jgi:probable F420-dependent oxidoreductase
LAKAAASVDLISKGRFILGIGTGYLKSEFFALGVNFDERNELFDEALEVMPLHWSGERFSYEGKHFSARDVVARPAPIRRPIPIWLGGNAKVTRRRVATRAQGWMPMSIPPSVATTTRTPHLALEEIGVAVRELKEMASGRGEDIDVMLLYTDESIVDTDKDVERHRDALGRMAEIGATWVSLVPELASERETLDFIEGFGATYLGANRV